MTETQSPAAREWDAGVIAAGGSLLQSWRWGEFKKRHGWSVARVSATANGNTAYAQILFRHRGPVSLAYIPRGPVLPVDDPALVKAILHEIDRACRRRRAISVIIELETPLPADLITANHLIPGPGYVQPARTVIVTLLDDEPLLMQMHQKTRYTIRLAMRRGVTVRDERGSDEGFDAFYSLMLDTGARNEFGIHAADYYRDVLETFADSSALMVARNPDGEPGSSLIVVGFGQRAYYLYGASSTRQRSNGPGFPIQFEAMRWARDHGYAEYDLWGIPAEDPTDTSTDEGSRIAGTRGGDWRGLYEFKVRFGGRIVSYPPPLERAYVPVLPQLARRFYQPS